MNIKGRDWSEQELEQVIELVGELVKANETLNAQMIAMNAKLQNEEKKVLQLNQIITWMSNNQNTYEA